MGRIVITEAEREKAFALFDQGEPIGRVALLLFGGHWYKAKKLREEYDALNVQAAVAEKLTAAAEPLVQEPETEPSPEPEPEMALELAQPAAVAAALDPPQQDEEPMWDITLQISAKRIDRMLLALSPQEKADAICGVLQARLSAEG